MSVDELFAVLMQDGRTVRFSGKWYDIGVLIFGSTGWLTLAVKTYFDWKKEQRAESAEARAQAAEKRAEAAEARSIREQRRAQNQAITPYLTKFNQGDLLYLFEQIVSLHDNPALQITNKEAKELRGYAAELEKLGTLLLLEQVPAALIYEHFGNQTITTRETRQLWENENMHYWQSFEKLYLAMKREKDSRQS